MNERMNECFGQICIKQKGFGTPAIYATAMHVMFGGSSMLKVLRAA